MRGEREVLVPLDRGRSAGKLRVDLGVVQLDVGPDELGDGIEIRMRSLEDAERPSVTTSVTLGRKDEGEMS